MDILPRFHSNIILHIRAVFKSNDDIWKCWTLCLLRNFPIETVNSLAPEIRRIAEHPTAGEKIEEADEYAFEIIQMCMNIDLNKVEKIECSSLRHIIGEYSDIGNMTVFVNFLNSFVLTERYENIDCQRPSTNITVYYKDGSTEPIEYSYTSLVYRGKRYKIDIDKTDELDSFLYPVLER